MKSGGLIISLDFELHWGMCDVLSVEQYKANLENVPEVVEELLGLFSEYDISATWCVVGLLFCRSKSQVNRLVPISKRPKTQSEVSSVYSVLDSLQEDFSNDVFHNAIDSILKIRSYSKQEIGTHTFSHYHALREGSSLESFQSDIDAVLNISKEFGLSIESIVYPRGQIRNDFNKVCQNRGLRTYRGTERAWYYKSHYLNYKFIVPRIFRLLDSYFKLSGINSYDTKNFKLDESGLLNIPSSRFLRPYNPKLKYLEGLRLNRIKDEMTEAARTNSIFHLWWHPHNFGSYMAYNFEFLVEILKHYGHLREQYNFASYSMSSLYHSIFSESIV